MCHGTDVFLRTTEGEVPVHVIYRRIDDEYLDPLQFRPESLVGCPGIVNAARAGRVTIANGVGNGVADDKLVYTYVPAMIRYYLGEEPILHNVETMHLVDPAVRKDALARRGELVFKRVDGSGGKGLVIGPSATGAELDELALDVEADPRHWIAQRVVALSTSPTWVDNTMVRRHVDLRPFAVNDGEDIWVLPGGLTRVALGEGGLVVNSSQGGGSKDTWVVGGGLSMPVLPPRQVAPFQAGPPMDAGPASDGELGVQQQQQQQQQAAATARRHVLTRALLSRVAESIFWVGRYVERAEGTARILDVSVYQALEQSDVEGSHAARRLLAVMGLPDSGTETLWQATERLATDPDSRSSIAGALAAARENTRAVRHVVPVEFWEHINATWAELPLRWETGRRAGPGLLPLVRQDPVRRHDGVGRHHDEPGPDLALLHPGPVPGADRRGGPPAGHGGVRRGVRQRAGHAAAVLRRLRALPATVPGRGRTRSGPGLPAARPALPPLGLRLADLGRGVPRPDQRRARGRLGRRPRPGGPGPGRTGVLGPGDPVPRPRDAARATAGLHLLGERRRDAPLLRPGPARCSGARAVRADEPNRRMAAAGLPRDALRLRRAGAGLVQRAATDATHRAAPDRPRDEGRDGAAGAPVLVHRLLGHASGGLQRGPGARGAVDHGELARRHAAVRRAGRLHVGGRGRRLADHGRPPVPQPLHRAGTRVGGDRREPARRSPARNGAPRSWRPRTMPCATSAG